MHILYKYQVYFKVVKAFESFSVPTTHEVHDPTSLP